MNVFVLCTGRCGSLTFTRACGHIENFTAAHESRVPLLGDDRLDFPDNHIEVDNRLAWFLGRLDDRWGDRAHYVHLTRDQELVAASWARRFHVLGGMATGYRDHILSGAARAVPISRAAAAADYVRTVNENIRLFLKDKTHVMNFALENAERDFPRFLDWIGARGDREAALAEWRHRHDTEIARTAPRQRMRDIRRRVSRAFFPPP